MFKTLIVIAFMPITILGMEFSNEIKEAPSEVKIDATTKKKISFCCIDKLKDLAARSYFIQWRGKHLDLIEKLSTLPTEIASRIANQKDQCGNTLLHTAAYLGDVELVEHLLKLGVNKHPNNKWLETPLLVAAQQGHIATCRLLYIPDSIERCHFTDLCAYIARIPGTDAINFEKEFFGNQPKQTNVVREDFCNVEQQQIDPKHLPFSEESSKIIIDQKYNCGNTYLHTAAYLGDVKFVLYLLSNGADKRVKNIWDETPLLVAAKQGHIAVCNLLYDPDTIENSDFNTLCQYVLGTSGKDAKNFKKKHCEKYLNDLSYASRLEFAALKGNYEAVKGYLPFICSVPNKDIITLNVINSGLSNMVSLLCDNREICGLFKKDDLLSLYLATLCGNVRIAYVLVEGGLTCSEMLHCAVRQKNKKLIKFYLKKFPKKLNSLDISKHTPLFYACLFGNFGLVEKLLKKGALVNLDGELHTALYAAVTQKHYRIVQLLRDNDAHFEEDDMPGAIKITENDKQMKELLAGQWQLSAINELIQGLKRGLGVENIVNQNNDK